MTEDIISVPSILASRFGGNREFKASANTLRDLINVLTQTYSNTVTDALLDSEGNLKPVINIYLNGKNINFLGGLDTSFKNGDKIYIMPAIAGG